ncbi:MAG TPA: circadian clock KaiB family protein [Nitrosomonas sp.]|nr:circadian clock KaiB family protein [Nitrosomonas sp.]
MKKTFVSSHSTFEALQNANIQLTQTRYKLELYITGNTPRAAKAIINIRTLCETHLKGRYDLEVVDICQNPALAEVEQIIATPTLIRKLPLPLRRFIGDMSHTERILLGLDIVFK